MNFREIKLKFKKENEERVEIFLSDLGIDNMAIEDPEDLINDLKQAFKKALSWNQIK